MIYRGNLHAYHEQGMGSSSCTFHDFRGIHYDPISDEDKKNNVNCKHYSMNWLIWFTKLKGKKVKMIVWDDEKNKVYDGPITITLNLDKLNEYPLLYVGAVEVSLEEWRRWLFLEYEAHLEVDYTVKGLTSDDLNPPLYVKDEKIEDIALRAIKRFRKELDKLKETPTS